MPTCAHCKKPIAGHPAIVHDHEGDIHYHPGHLKHRPKQRRPIDTATDRLGVILAEYPKAYGYDGSRRRLSDDLLRIVLAHPELLSKVPDAVIGRANHDSSLAPGSGGVPHQGRSLGPRAERARPRDRGAVGARARRRAPGASARLRETIMAKPTCAHCKRAGAPLFLAPAGFKRR